MIFSRWHFPDSIVSISWFGCYIWHARLFCNEEKPELLFCHQRRQIGKEFWILVFLALVWPENMLRRLFVFVLYSFLKWKFVMWAVVQSDIWYELHTRLDLSHTRSQHGPLSALRRISDKNSLFLPSWMSPQRRRRFRKLGNRIRKSFRAAKRWKSSFRVRRRSSTFRVRNALPNILTWRWRLGWISIYICV